VETFVSHGARFAFIDTDKDSGRNPSLPAREEMAVRRKLVEKILAALQTEVAGQTVF